MECEFLPFDDWMDRIQQVRNRWSSGKVFWKRYFDARAPAWISSMLNVLGWSYPNIVQQAGDAFVCPCGKLFIPSFEPRCTYCDGFFPAAAAAAAAAAVEADDEILADAEIEETNTTVQENHEQEEKKTPLASAIEENPGTPSLSCVDILVWLDPPPADGEEVEENDQEEGDNNDTNDDDEDGPLCNWIRLKFAVLLDPLMPPDEPQPAEEPEIPRNEVPLCWHLHNACLIRVQLPDDDEETMFNDLMENLDIRSAHYIRSGRGRREKRTRLQFVAVRVEGVLDWDMTRASSMTGVVQKVMSQMLRDWRYDYAELPTPALRRSGDNNDPPLEMETDY